MNKELIEWTSTDDSCEIQKDGTIESYHCTASGQEELEYIIDRLRTLYKAGGAVEKIVISTCN